jgi:N-acetyl-anhydromuramyl-L-alanine amidase AmpD
MEIIDLRNELPKNRDPERVWKIRRSREIDMLVVHQSACKDCSTKGIAKYHTSPTEDRNNDGRIDAWETNHLSAKGAPGICYHYTIERNGTVYKCNSHWEIVWHAGVSSVNKRSIGICLLGDFSGPTYVGREKPTKKQLVSLDELLEYFLIADTWSVDNQNIIGHCEAKKSKESCPGTIIMDFIKKTYRA